MSDTIVRLAAFRGWQSALSPEDDRLSVLPDFGSNPGGLRSHFYVPPDLPRGAPLGVVLHGCTQNAAGYDHRAGWSQLADQAGFALLYPEQHHANNPNLCFNWFRPGDIRRDAGEALSIRQMIGREIGAPGPHPETFESFRRLWAVQIIVHSRQHSHPQPAEEAAERHIR